MLGTHREWAKREVSRNMRAKGEPAEEERLLPGPEPCVRHVAITGLWETVPIPPVLFCGFHKLLDCLRMPDL